MSTPYTGNAGNPTQGTKVVVTEPADGDALAVTSVNVGIQQLTDFQEMMYEQLSAILATTWIPRTSGTARALWAVAKTLSNSYIAVGDAAAAPPTILGSPDGVTWTAQTGVGTSTLAFGVCYSGSVAVVIANGASGQNVMSGPGTWTLRTSGIALASQQGGIVLGSSGLVIVGGVGGAAAVSRNLTGDGVTWAAQTLGAAANQMTCVTWAQQLTLYVAAGYNTGTNAAEIWTSPDGVTWTQRTVPTAGTSHACDILWAPRANLAMMIALDGSTWTSSDCVTWTKQSNAASFSFSNGMKLLHTGRFWFAFPGTGANWMLSSSHDNGVTWFARGQRNPTIRGVGIGGEQASSTNQPLGSMIIVGDSGTIWSGLTTQIDFFRNL